MFGSKADMIEKSDPEGPFWLGAFFVCTRRGGAGVEVVFVCEACSPAAVPWSFQSAGVGGIGDNGVLPKSCCGSAENRDLITPFSRSPVRSALCDLEVDGTPGGGGGSGIPGCQLLAALDLDWSLEPGFDG